jgi:hypothetical protein
MPELAGKFPSIPHKAGTAAFGEEVVLVPEDRLLVRVSREGRARDVLDQIATARYETAAALWPLRRSGTSGARPPVEPADYAVWNTERIQ